MNASIQKRIDISAFGMPVVDYVVYSDDTPELSTEIRSNLKYQMENSTKSNEILSKLYHSPKVHKTVGGSALNTLRMANFLIQKENNFYMGCIGKDLNGDLIKHTLKEEKIFNCVVTHNEGMLADYCKRNEITTTIRGLRNNKKENRKTQKSRR